MSNSRNKYSDKEILSQLKAHYKRNGKIIRKNFDADKTVCSSFTVKKRFGSWKKALKIAGLEKKYRITYSDKELLEQIKSHYKINPSMTRVSFQEDKMVCSSSIIYMRFGNWKKALLKAGCKNNRRMINKNFVIDKKELLEKQQKIPKKREVIYTKAELVGKYRRLRKKEKYKNTEIAMEDFCKEIFINSKLIIEHFGNWKKFCEISQPLYRDRNW